MSTFREHKSIVDRAAEDRDRHKKKIEKAIKDSIKDVIADESIIGQNGKKKIRIPVKGIKEYRFIYGNNERNGQVGSGGKHNLRRGQRIGAKRAKKAASENAGNEAGEETYEVEITLEDLAEYLFADLELPDLDKKRFRYLSEDVMRRKGYRFEGIRPRLSKKETLKRKIKRKKRAIGAGSYDPSTNERFPFHKNDLKYHYMKPHPKENTAAVVFFLMDVSGSMTTEKKYIARSYFFLLYQFLRHKYDKIEVVFISHTVSANRVSEDEFFQRITTGGTMMSSALETELEIINKEYHPNSWNIYTFYAGDGENWQADNNPAMNLLSSLKEVNQMVVYTEISPNRTHPEEEGDSPTWAGPTFAAWREEQQDSMWTMCAPLMDTKFKRLLLTKSDQIWDSFKDIFGVRS
jgi:sporulation protein YhbH|tara:strand:- start:3987 stop:5204 length:1218 start_codon:yes stop_codon:yes gene_type:complete